MNNLIRRFYFLSKLTTSLILLILLIILSYLFIKAYLEQKDLNTNNIIIEELSNKVTDLAKIVKQNSTNLNLVKNYAKENKQSMQDISTTIATLNNSKINDNILPQIEKLSEENAKLKDEINNFSSIINSLDNLQLTSIQTDKSLTPLKNIIRLIKLKLENGTNFSEEVSLLQNLEIGKEYLSDVEKLSIYATERFLGLDSLKSNFDKISSNYLNDYFLKKYNSQFIKPLFNLILIEPNLNVNIEDENILLLSLTKQQLLYNNLNESIQHLIKLKDVDYYFSTWIQQAKYYVEVNSLLNRF